QLSAVSSNPGLVPNQNIVFGGFGANRTVNVTPAAGQTGTATITVTVNDGPNNTSTSFVVTVTGGTPTPTPTATPTPTPPPPTPTPTSTPTATPTATPTPGPTTACQRSMTIDHTKVPSTQSNFTVLVSITDP